MSAMRFDLLIGIAIGVVIAWLYFLVWRARYTAAIREDAVQRSLAVTTGKVHEQLIPYLPDFGYNPKDARFLGSPVDLVVFDGLAQGQPVLLPRGQARRLPVAPPRASGSQCHRGSCSGVGGAARGQAARRGLILCLHSSTPKPAIQSCNALTASRPIAGRAGAASPRPRWSATSAAGCAKVWASSRPDRPPARWRARP